MDEKRLAEARAEEAAAAEDYKKAEQESGAKKQAIFEERKKKEEEMKQTIAATTTPQQISAAASNAPKKIEGTGSVWNTNSYHWEEKSVATLANDTLRASLSAFTHNMNDATLSILEITTLTGDSSVSIRKGKKIISFDYNIVVKWKCVLSDSDGMDLS